ncbi:Uncharacterized protein Rs2_51554 [Raphanus sativus]|nr:Uncharacterized protein Rs2_51554 [Raphanus sativus]
MSQRNKSGPKLELKLNLSPPPSQANLMSLVRSPSRSNTTSPSSCVSSETYQEEMETTISMVLVGCPRCLMYVMLSQDDPKCPKCKSTVLLDFSTKTPPPLQLLLPPPLNAIRHGGTFLFNPTLCPNINLYRLADPTVLVSIYFFCFFSWLFGVRVVLITLHV